jgi:hypothetical protein
VAGSRFGASLMSKHEGNGFNGDNEEPDMSEDRRFRLTRPTYPFRLRDPVSGIWVRARYIAKLKDVGDCLAAWEIVAPPLAPKTS